MCASMCVSTCECIYIRVCVCVCVILYLDACTYVHAFNILYV